MLSKERACLLSVQPSDTHTAAARVPEGFSDEVLGMALLRGAPLSLSRRLVATTFMFQRKEGEAHRAHRALNCVSSDARRDEEVQKAGIFSLISVAKG